MHSVILGTMRCDISVRPTAQGIAIGTIFTAEIVEAARVGGYNLFGS
jgi:hypothetical protein